MTEIERIRDQIERAFDGDAWCGPALMAALQADVDSGGAGSISAGMQRLADAGRARIFDIGDRFWIDVDDAAALEKAEAHLLARSRELDAAS